jgi:hypothetical protein
MDAETSVARKTPETRANVCTLSTLPLSAHASRRLEQRQLKDPETGKEVVVVRTSSLVTSGSTMRAQCKVISESPLARENAG